MSMELFWADLKHAGRSIAAKPAFAALVIVTLALGIGATSAVFALLDGVLWRSLPYRDPARLVFIWQTLPEHNVAELEPTPYDFEAWHTLRSFESLGLVFSDTYTLSGEDNPERVRGARITSSLLPMLGIGPRLGRPFDDADDDDRSPPTVILSDGLWKRRYGSDASLVGRNLLINGVPTTVIGVMPESAKLPGPLADHDELWLSARLTPAERANAISHNYTVVARLSPTATVASAEAELEGFAGQLAVDQPDTHRGVGARIVTVEEQTLRGLRPSLTLGAGGVMLLLAITCANVFTLWLARSASRRLEIAVRTALGASRLRLLSLATAESLVLAGLGGLAGLAIGNLALRFLLPLFSSSLPGTSPVGIDARAVVFTAGLSALLGLTFGLASAGSKSEATLMGLKGSSRTATMDRSQSRLRSVLLVTQISLAVALMAAAGLLLQSVVRLSRVSPGFDASHVLTFRLALTNGSYARAGSRLVLVRQLVNQLSAAPAISRVGVTSNIPFGGSRGADEVEIEGRPAARGESIIIDQRYVTPDYFQTMRIPLVSGRLLSRTDDERAEHVVLINRTMARRYFPSSSPVNQRVRVTAGVNEGIWCRIVGVVEDVRHIALSREAVPEMYAPYWQAPAAAFTVVVRTTGDPERALPVVREALRAIDPSLPMYDVRTMQDRIAGSMAQTRATMLLLMATAMLAATLSAVAIYGSVWYAVSTRTPEIGIRLALGASPSVVARGVLANAMRSAVVGGGVGLAAVGVARPFLATFLFDTPATDVGTLATVAGAMILITTLACAVPVWRAMRVDPTVALRGE